MTLHLDDWHEDYADPEEDYQRLLDSLGWTGWFGFSFWQCSPAKGSNLIERVRHDLPGKKTIEVLTLKAEDRNFFDCVKALPNYDSIEVLFVKGFEQSIYIYEHQANSISETSPPCLISHLNLNQEQFHTQFKFFLVFLVPPFTARYMIRPHPAPDLFCWRFEWETPEEEAAVAALESEWEWLSSKAL
jgi:hypothetical protein